MILKLCNKRKSHTLVSFHSKYKKVYFFRKAQNETHVLYNVNQK